MQEVFIWIGIVFCMSQSALFSGSNLAVFSLSRLRLESAAAVGDANAARALNLRRDANFTLVTILVGNVAINVLLTLLAESVMAGVLAFLFSTIVITAIGEIIPQAYLSRHALKAIAFVSPLLNIYRFLLWPIAKPIGHLLDLWVGPEAIPWFRERELEDILRHHGEMAQSEVGDVEATGAINFLALDDLTLGEEGSAVDPQSVIALQISDGRPVFPRFEHRPDDEFLQRLRSSGKRWIILTDSEEEPLLVLDARSFLLDAAFSLYPKAPEHYCRRPVVVRDAAQTVGWALSRIRQEVSGGRADSGNPLLVWSAQQRRIITGSDMQQCLFRGIG
ncbi:DUF21 domain-containing protein [Chelativorans sp. YIM 93263]|uniref:DUF21 domain-containing protein n=1 Tax=Chelativorans sp. YIM 93263 TaxID=2906648 RepID=UPI00237882A2|nr:DUF21 domain-containing protein [Chelativorans sp. YIM 93263]